MFHTIIDMQIKLYIKYVAKAHRTLGGMHLCRRCGDDFVHFAQCVVEEELAPYRQDECALAGQVQGWVAMVLTTTVVMIHVLATIGEPPSTHTGYTDQPIDLLIHAARTDWRKLEYAELPSSIRIMLCVDSMRMNCRLAYAHDVEKVCNHQDPLYYTLFSNSPEAYNNLTQNPTT